MAQNTITHDEHMGTILIIAIILTTIISFIAISNRDMPEWEPVMLDLHTGKKITLTSGHIGTYLWATAEKVGNTTKINYYLTGCPHNINWENPTYYEIVREEKASIFYFLGWKGYKLIHLENTNPYFEIDDKTYGAIMSNSGLWTVFY